MHSFGGFACLPIDKKASRFSSKNILNCFSFMSCCCRMKLDTCERLVCLTHDLNLAVFSMVINIPFGYVQTTASVVF